MSAETMERVGDPDPVEAERYWTDEEYARALGKTVRWVRDHAGPRYHDIKSSLVGGERRFSAEDRAENRRRFSAAADPAPAPAPEGLRLPTDPAQLARMLAEVRRVSR